VVSRYRSLTYSDPYGPAAQDCDPPGSCEIRGALIGGAVGAGAGLLLTGTCATATWGVCAAGGPAIVGASTGLGASVGGLLGALTDFLTNDDADPVGTAGGERDGKPFTPGGKRQIDAAGTAPDGSIPCTYCGRTTTRGTGQGTSIERDHTIPKSQGGNGDPSNGSPTCRDCNRQKGPELRSNGNPAGTVVEGGSNDGF